MSADHAAAKIVIVALTDSMSSGQLFVASDPFNPLSWRERWVRELNDLAQNVRQFKPVFVFCRWRYKKIFSGDEAGLTLCRLVPNHSTLMGVVFSSRPAPAVYLNKRNWNGQGDGVRWSNCHGRIGGQLLLVATFGKWSFGWIALKANSCNPLSNWNRCQ